MRNKQIRDEVNTVIYRRLWLVGCLLLYLALTCYQLGLPGLHYDEAREAGVSAMEILTGASPTLFRETGIQLFGRQWPLMVQDYIGALNVYLAMPLLWITGIGVPNLRLLSVLTGLVTLVLIERTVTEWLAWQDKSSSSIVPTNPPISVGGLMAITLLVASPTFVFWSRQGIFVTNLTQPLIFGCLWQGVRWVRCGCTRSLLYSACLGGCALYAKLLAIWIVGPFVLMAAAWWLWRGRQHEGASLSPPLVLSIVAVFVFPLAPFLWFNWQSGGTLQAIGGNLATSYYGVNNLAIWSNLTIRLEQFRQVITGDHLWYLGGIYGNQSAFVAGVVIVLLGLFRQFQWLFVPLLLLVIAMIASIFTLSDLFITHYSLIQPLALAIVAVALSTSQVVPISREAISHGIELVKNNDQQDLAEPPKAILQLWLVGPLVVLWLVLDLTATIRYHGALTHSGGLADHSDASYHLAYHLRYNGLGAPIALDWGFDAPVRYLTVGSVTPIEIFGYDSPLAPDADFATHLRPFLTNPANVYLLHSPQATIFQGRREQFLAEVDALGRAAQVDVTFAQRDGMPLYELWRVVE